MSSDRRKKDSLAMEVWNVWNANGGESYMSKLDIIESIYGSAILKNSKAIASYMNS